jgi:hypothetical protein
MNPLRVIAAVLMLVSGITHISQRFVYKASVIGTASFRLIGLWGIIYFIIGLFLLLGKTRVALWAGAILPAIGGLLGVYRFFFLHINPFSVFHVIIDLIVVTSCVYLLVRT